MKQQRLSRRLWLLPLFGLLLFVVIRCAWLADDAYITFRASDNLIHGFGPRWNTFERVQAFTTPLWMLVVALCTGITGELITTVAVVQILLTLASAWLVARHARSTLSGALALGILCLSRAFVDFSSAGMENALAHFLIVLFAIETLRGGSAFVRALLASLVLCTRLDLVWLVAPSLIDELVRAPTTTVRKKIALGMLPIVLWELFAFLYFGSFLPNSARAKITTGIPIGRLARQGAEYFFDSLHVDPLTLVTIVLAAALAGGVTNNRRARLLALGSILALGYVLLVGGDFMSGRFFTIPLALAAVLVSRMRFGRARAALAGGGAIVLGAVAGFPTITDALQKWPDIELTVVDCRLAFHPFTGLTVGMLPNYIEYGRKLRTTPGVTVQPGIGIAGYYAGPTVKILDAFALADPLRSRFPIPDPRNESFLKMGHLMRPIPAGYIESMDAEDANRVSDPRVREYAGIVANVTRGPVFDLDRIATAAKLELGLYDDLLDEYFATYDEKPILVKDLEHPRGVGLDPKCYTWWRTCADEGVAFTESGLRVEIGLQLRPSKIVFDATPDDYWVIFRLGGKEQRRAFAPREQQIVEVGGDVTDAIVFVPRTGRGVRTLRAVIALP